MTDEPQDITETDADITDIDQDELYSKLEKWKAALRMNRELQSNYRDEITKYRDQRDELKNEIKMLREAALKEKDLRDSFNDTVAKLKEDRSAANTQIAILKKKRNDAWENVRQIRNTLKIIIERQKDARIQMKSLYPMFKRLEELDWTIMTKSMPFEKEKELMNQIDEIVSCIADHRTQIDFKVVSMDFDEAKKRIDELKEAAQQYHELMIQTVADGEKIHARILELVKESEKHHQAMKELFAQIDPIKADEELAHQKMVDNIKELQMLEQGKDEIYKEIRAVEKKLAYFKHLEALNRAKEEQKILDQKTQEALTKYQSGKKLSMDEFTLLMKKGLLKTE
ncbi:MAG: coiled-coil protein [Candidatus Helarchaeota archaeon]